MRDYMRNQGLVDGITGCRNRQRDLEKEIERLCDIIETQEDAIRFFYEEIERLRNVLERIAEGYPHGSLARDMAANALKERDDE